MFFSDFCCLNILYFGFFLFAKTNNFMREKICASGLELRKTKKFCSITLIEKHFLVNIVFWFPPLFLGCLLLLLMIAIISKVEAELAATGHTHRHT